MPENDAEFNAIVEELQRAGFVTIGASCGCGCGVVANCRPYRTVRRTSHAAVAPWGP